MLLKRLSEYYDRLPEALPTLYVRAPVRYHVRLDGNGRLLGTAPIDTVDKKDLATQRGTRHPVPQVQRAVGIKPLLFADNSEYTFGLARTAAGGGKASRAERVAECNRAYLDLLHRCAVETSDRAVLAVEAYLNNDPASMLDAASLEEPAFDRGAIITFLVDDEFVVDRPAVQQFWASVNDPDADPGNPAPVLQCVICGQEKPALRRLTGKVKGVRGGNTVGTSIISANEKAFESYGLEASLVSPVCAVCAERFTKSINHLIADESSRLYVGDATFIFWTRKPTTFNPRRHFAKPDPKEVRELLDGVRRGHSVPEVDEITFYAAALSGSGGRCVVRDYVDTTVGSAKRQIARWFEDQAIVGPWGEEPEPQGLFALAAATVRDARKEPPPTPVGRALWHAALTGTPLPKSLLYQAMRRNRAEQGVNHTRAMLVKLVLRGEERAADERSEDTMIKLNTEHPSDAYHCGRLLAVLEGVQDTALPGVKAGIVDRFYGTASAAPASVFARLVRGAQPHLGRLQRDKPGAYARLQGQLEEIQGHIGEFPRVLTLDGQGLFALGYYHQRAFDRAARVAAGEAKRARAAANDQDNDQDNKANGNQEGEN